jgi:curved DNA-binding protein CbpA
MAEDENVDIDVELRKYLVEMCARLDTIDHYSLLDVPRTADSKTIKRAYNRLAGRLHPDRFFRKNLGSYKAGLQRVFTQITIAHDTLTSPEQRAEYDATLGPAPAQPAGAPSPAPPPAAPAPPAPTGPSAAAMQEKRKTAMDALAARFLDAKAKARQHVEAGARAAAAGDLVGAAEAYRTALRLVPGDAASEAALRDIERMTAGRVAESRRKQAMLEERYGHWAEAAASWQRVLEAAPGDEEARRRLAAALEKSRARR